MIAAVAMFGAALWVGFADQLGSGAAAQQSASSSPQAGVALAEAAPVPIVSAPAVVVPDRILSEEINGLHVICPLTRGRTVHLLLTADTYYKAVTPGEVALLTERFGPAITNIDPAHLPPKSTTSVTELLTG
ncbi:MAG: hypothetical protein ACRD0K_22360 [Egibacteraceae bacterium]